LAVKQVTLFGFDKKRTAGSRREFVTVISGCRREREPEHYSTWVWRQCVVNDSLIAVITPVVYFLQLLVLHEILDNENEHPGIVGLALDI